jgi:hypothetical protein
MLYIEFLEILELFPAIRYYLFHFVPEDIRFYLGYPERKSLSRDVGFGNSGKQKPQAHFNTKIFYLISIVN